MIQDMHGNIEEMAYVPRKDTDQLVDVSVSALCNLQIAKDLSYLYMDIEVIFTWTLKADQIRWLLRLIPVLLGAQIVISPPTEGGGGGY